MVAKPTHHLKMAHLEPQTLVEVEAADLVLAVLQLELVVLVVQALLFFAMQTLKQLPLVLDLLVQQQQMVALV
jgi:hypothetical protein